ncbi:MAG: RNA polymerase sigma factor [Patescibacteria group bacterium]
MSELYIPRVHIADEELALRIQKGDRECFGILMERYTEKLTRYGRRFLSNMDNIEDIVQDVFIKTFQNMQDFDTSLKFSSWIYRIAHNAFVNGLKKQQKSAISMPYFDLDVFISHNDYTDPKIEEREYKELKEMIEKGLDKLKPKYKEIIILHYIEDMSYKDISDILRVPIGTVGVRVKRGREQLKEIYTDMNVDVHSQKYT